MFIKVNNNLFTVVSNTLFYLINAYSLQRQFVIQSHMNVLDNKQFDNFDIDRLFFTVILVFDPVCKVTRHTTI